MRLKKKMAQIYQNEFNFINQKATWKGHMAKLVLLKNNAQIFLKKF